MRSTRSFGFRLGLSQTSRRDFAAITEAGASTRPVRPPEHYWPWTDSTAEETFEQSAAGSWSSRATVAAQHAPVPPPATKAPPRQRPLSKAEAKLEELKWLWHNGPPQPGQTIDEARAGAVAPASSGPAVSAASAAGDQRAADATIRRTVHRGLPLTPRRGGRTWAGPRTSPGGMVAGATPEQTSSVAVDRFATNAAPGPLPEQPRTGVTDEARSPRGSGDDRRSRPSGGGERGRASSATQTISAADLATRLMSSRPNDAAVSPRDSGGATGARANGPQSTGAAETRQAATSGSAQTSLQRAVSRVAVTAERGERDAAGAARIDHMRESRVANAGGTTATALADRRADVRRIRHHDSTEAGVPAAIALVAVAPLHAVTAETLVAIGAWRSAPMWPTLIRRTELAAGERVEVDDALVIPPRGADGITAEAEVGADTRLHELRPDVDPDNRPGGRLGHPARMSRAAATTTIARSLRSTQLRGGSHGLDGAGVALFGTRPRVTRSPDGQAVQWLAAPAQHTAFSAVSSAASAAVAPPSGRAEMARAESFRAIGTTAEPSPPSRPIVARSRGLLTVVDGPTSNRGSSSVAVAEREDFGASAEASRRPPPMGVVESIARAVPSPTAFADDLSAAAIAPPAARFDTDSMYHDPIVTDESQPRAAAVRTRPTSSGTALSTDVRRTSDETPVAATRRPRRWVSARPGALFSPGTGNTSLLRRAAPVAGDAKSPTSSPPLMSSSLPNGVRRIVADSLAVVQRERQRRTDIETDSAREQPWSIAPAVLRSAAPAATEEIDTADADRDPVRGRVAQPATRPGHVDRGDATTIPTDPAVAPLASAATGPAPVQRPHRGRGRRRTTTAADVPQTDSRSNAEMSTRGPAGVPGEANRVLAIADLPVAPAVVQRSLAEPIREAAPPVSLAEQFLTELGRHRSERPTPLPIQFRPIADVIVGDRRPLISTSTASRRALAAVDKVAATTGDVIHLDRVPTGGNEINAIIAHELTHVAAPSPAPRFFDDDRHSPEERRATEIGNLMRRAPVLSNMAAAAATTTAPVLRRAPSTSVASPDGATIRRVAGGVSTESGGSVKDLVAKFGGPERTTGTPPTQTTQTSSQGGNPMPQFQPEGSTTAQAWIDPDEFTNQLRRNFDLIVELLEDRIISDLERRGGRFRGDF